jgi:phenylalanyl-tRNA synthetase alpha chain
MSLLKLKNQALALISQARSRSELETIRLTFLGRKGQLNQAFQTADKAKTGRLFNAIKAAVTAALNQKEQQLAGTNDTWLDPTAPGQKPPIGHLHPLSQAIADIQRIFEHLGFTRVRYPEVDWEWYVFDALNMPADHPARDEWETIFIDAPADQKMGRMVLTTHTSNGQVREMQRLKTPPIRMLNLGKCYRRQQDATHTIMFHQFEGLVIDHGIAIPHLKGTLDYFGREWFGPKIKSRIRPFHFRFTEPSFEVDFTCTACGGHGCRFCKSGWVEVGGAGLVHPNVLRAGGINPEKYSGFAFGWGVERVLRLKPGLNIDDIRLLYSTNQEFLNQF